MDILRQPTCALDPFSIQHFMDFSRSNSVIAAGLLVADDSTGLQERADAERPEAGDSTRPAHRGRVAELVAAAYNFSSFGSRCFLSSNSLYEEAIFLADRVRVCNQDLQGSHHRRHCCKPCSVTETCNLLACWALGTGVLGRSTLGVSAEEGGRRWLEAWS